MFRRCSEAHPAWRLQRSCGLDPLQNAELRGDRRDINKLNNYAAIPCRGRSQSVIRRGTSSFRAAERAGAPVMVGLARLWGQTRPASRGGNQRRAWLGNSGGRGGALSLPAAAAKGLSGAPWGRSQQGAEQREGREAERP